MHLYLFALSLAVLLSLPAAAQARMAVMAAPEEVACTMDAKICPDGSSVARTGPNCSFGPCPGEAGYVAPPPLMPMDDGTGGGLDGQGGVVEGNPGMEAPEVDGGEEE